MDGVVCHFGNFLLVVVDEGRNFSRWNGDLESSLFAGRLKFVLE